MTEPLDLEKIKAVMDRYVSGEPVMVDFYALEALIAEVERLRAIDLNMGQFAYRRGYREGHDAASRGTT